MTKKARINQQMGQNNQKDQKGPKMTAAVMLVQNNQNNQKIWSPHISHTILKVRFFWDTLYKALQFHIFIETQTLLEWLLQMMNIAFVSSSHIQMLPVVTSHCHVHRLRLHL